MQYFAVLTGLPTRAKPDNEKKKEQKHPQNIAGIAWFSYEEEVRVNKKEQKRQRDNAGIVSVEFRGCGLPMRAKPR